MSVDQETQARWHDAATEIAGYGRRLITDGLAYGTAGNLSCRVGDHVVISPTSIPYEDVQPDDLWVLSLDGDTVRRARSGRRRRRRSTSRSTPLPRRPPSSTRTRPRSWPCPRRWSTCPRSTTRSPGSAGQSPVVGYQRFGSDSLASGIQTALCHLDRPRSAAILQNHGAVTYGSSMHEAYDKAIMLEWLARAYRLALQIGNPRILTTEELDEVTAEARRRRYAMAASRDGDGG